MTPTKIHGLPFSLPNSASHQLSRISWVIIKFATEMPDTFGHVASGFKKNWMTVQHKQWLRSQRRSKVLFFFFFDPLRPHSIKKKSEKFEKSTTLHPMLYASSSKTLAGKKNCISGHGIVFTDIRGCLTANFFIYNRAVNNLLETVTLRPPFRWIPNGCIVPSNKTKLFCS